MSPPLYYGKRRVVSLVHNAHAPRRARHAIADSRDRTIALCCAPSRNLHAQQNTMMRRRRSSPGRSSPGPPVETGPPGPTRNSDPCQRRNGCRRPIEARRSAKTPFVLRTDETCASSLNLLRCSHRRISALEYFGPPLPQRLRSVSLARGRARGARRGQLALQICSLYRS